MYCRKLIFLVGFVAIKAFCADWDVFQDYESASSDLIATDSSIFLASGALDPLTINEDSSTIPNLEETFNLAIPADSSDLFNSGEFDTASNNLLASAKGACSLSPARRNRARGDDTSSCPSSSSPTLSLPNFSSDLVNDDRLRLPHFGRRITTYENGEQMFMSQTFCPSHKIMLPSLIIPVCSSEEPEDAQSLLMSTLYTLFNCFMSTFPLFFPFLQSIAWMEETVVSSE